MMANFNQVLDDKKRGVIHALPDSEMYTTEYFSTHFCVDVTYGWPQV